jgi:transcriptional regulator with XRE-family HTH domain
MKLTNEQVSEIKEMINDGLKQKTIAKKFGVTRGYISSLARGKSRSDVGPEVIQAKILGQPAEFNLEEINASLIGRLERANAQKNLVLRQLKNVQSKKTAVDDLVTSLSSIIRPIPRPKPVSGRAKKGHIQETMVLMLSDTHLDQVVLPEEVDGLEDFNFQVGTRRLEYLAEEVLNWKNSLKGFQFDELVIAGLGDYTSGEIHGAAAKSYYGDQVQNDLAIASVFAQMFVDFASHFKKVTVINTVGNHGRVSDKVGFGKWDSTSNHDHMIMRIVEVHCKNIPNINFSFPCGLSSMWDIEGHTFFMEHGHTRRNGSAAWSRAKSLSSKISALHGGEVDYFLSGHFHTPGQTSVSGGGTLIANGALLATDSYAYQSLSEAGSPSQKIFGVHKRNGVTWSIDLKLKTQDEGFGPVRYKVPEVL